MILKPGCYQLVGELKMSSVDVFTAWMPPESKVGVEIPGIWGSLRVATVSQMLEDVVFISKYIQTNVETLRKLMYDLTDLTIIKEQQPVMKEEKIFRVRNQLI